jgi:tripartite motif-containing protein 71
VFLTKWVAEGIGDGQFHFLYGVPVASDGSLYVADSKNHRIQKFSVGP